jgi:hypothetical protein
MEEAAMAVFLDDEPRPRKPTVCQHCRYPMTWEAQRRQFGRLMRSGFTKAEAKALLPRCQKCMTVLLENRRDNLKQTLSPLDFHRSKSKLGMTTTR